jgi:hypothetical protein
MLQLGRMEGARMEADKTEICRYRRFLQT